MSTRPVVDATTLKTDPASTGFKKDEQVIGRPPVTDHDIHDDYVHNPPDNLQGQTRTSNPGKKEGAYEVVDDSEPGVLGSERDAPSRRHIYEVVNAEETSVHPNNPVQ